MKANITALHYRLEAIMRMIEKCDNRLVTFKKLVEKWQNYTCERNFSARQFNKYKKIKQYLQMPYAEVFTRMAMKIAEHKSNAKPVTPVLSESMMNEILKGHKVTAVEEVS